MDGLGLKFKPVLKPAKRLARLGPRLIRVGTGHPGGRRGNGTRGSRGGRAAPQGEPGLVGAGGGRVGPQGGTGTRGSRRRATGPQGGTGRGSRRRGGRAAGGTGTRPWEPEGAGRAAGRKA
ncbi:rRNA 2'-O-methyltransferase fibrillarin-like [Herrania umbratica]|uniref:rRNA 2'-O-methyltransferase fibrillarin-like n=1 Tax=Herrania umbratica TaxID=108875 RepID=A0A6J1AN02_9ROSI|nr:rRNA 2'-O-methyltransferase fibrillarin-like [Herrania umbratica]